MRLDKWLWAARFFKTRNQACVAIDAGKVRLNADRAKPAKEVRIGDLICVLVGRIGCEIQVRALCDTRGPAAFAQTLYQETTESANRRVADQMARAMQPRMAPSHKGRPTKKDRRALERLYRET